MFDSPRTFVTSRAAAGEMVSLNAPVSIRKNFGGRSLTRVGMSSMWPKRNTGVYDLNSGPMYLSRKPAIFGYFATNAFSESDNGGSAGSAVKFSFPFGKS